MSSLSQKLQQDDAVRARVSAGVTRLNLARFVSAKRSEPTVVYVYYRPDAKPPQVGNHVGTTEHQFQCHAVFDFHESTNESGQLKKFEIEGVTVSLELSFRITVPEMAWAGTKVHEETHRKIYEHFYDLGPEAAQRIGE